MNFYHIILMLLNLELHFSGYRRIRVCTLICFTSWVTHTLKHNTMQICVKNRNTEYQLIMIELKGSDYYTSHSGFNPFGQKHQKS